MAQLLSNWIHRNLIEILIVVAIVGILIAVGSQCAGEGISIKLRWRDLALLF